MWVWLSNKRMTIAVRIVDGRIVETPPIVRAFKGQPTKNLVRWMMWQDPNTQAQIIRLSDGRATARELA